MLLAGGNGPMATPTAIPSPTVEPTVIATISPTPIEPIVNGGGLDWWAILLIGIVVLVVGVYIVKKFPRT